MRNPASNHKKQVPFYANHEDGTHCMLAVYRSLFDYFLGRKLSWHELESFAGYKPGVTAWSLRSITQMAAMGFDIKMIEPFDYAQYLACDETYLAEMWPPDKLKWQLAHTNIRDIHNQIPEFLEKVIYENRVATLEDIDTMLDEGRLVNVMLDAAALNDLEGYEEHSILVLRRDSNDYIAHDPGGKLREGQPERRIARSTLWQAMGAEHNTSEVTGYKLKERRNLRLDQYVINMYPELSRSYAVRLIDSGRITVNGKPSKAGHKLREHDAVHVDYDPIELNNIPDIDLPVLYEDEDCIVIDKPAGILTHNKSNYDLEATVASFLRRRTNHMEGQRAGIVHRLDRLTSGVIICAKTPAALAWLQKQFHDRHAKKTYTAIVKGTMKPAAAVIDMPIERNPKAPATFRVGVNGKPASTGYRTLQSNATHSLLELMPKTGRTHQLRVHLAEQHHPIVGDFLYNGEAADRLYLHAERLEITIPSGKIKRFEAPLPAAFKNKMKV